MHCTRIMSGHACAMYSFYCNLIKFYGNLIVLAFLSIITTFIKKIKAQILATSSRMVKCKGGRLRAKVRQPQSIKLCKGAGFTVCLET